MNGLRLLSVVSLSSLLFAAARDAAAQDPPDRSPARAGESGAPSEPVNAGRQVDPPSPPPPTEEDPEFSARQRQAIRGCAVDMDCSGELARALREFELEAFPRQGSSSPWIDDDDANGHGAIRNVRDSGHRGQTARRSAGTFKPSELRPDLVWLDDLELPDIPFQWDERIIKYLEFYKEDERGRRLMSQWLSAQGAYRKMIVRQLRKAQLPEDLLYVAMIESSYDPHEYSRSGASGLWQFMPGAGHIYGLYQDRWVDERNDPVKSTKAAVAYFEDLHQRFGDWELALAAYNAGYGGVLKSMAKYNTNDFWKLLEMESALPWESSIYVPKAIAAAIVGHNREAFGYGDVADDPEVVYDSVTVEASVSLAVIARAAGANTRDVERLNPQIRRGRTPPGKKFVVRIPQGTADQFAKKFPELRGEWDTQDAYVVRHGERFEDIATTHGISPSKLRELNGIVSEAEITGGTIIVVPRVSEDLKRKNAAKAEADLYRSGIPEGDEDDKLIVPVPDPDRKIAGKKPVFYRVVSGDTQFGISRAFGVSRKDLADWNGLDPEANITARMVLQVWVSSDFDPAARGIVLLSPDRIHVVRSGSPEHMELAEERLGRKRILYECKKRESFEQIGRKFGLGPRDVARINRLPYDTVLSPGDKILVYQVVDASASDRAAKQAQQKRRSTPKRSDNKKRKR